MDTTAKTAIVAARNEIAAESQRKAIDLLKTKLRALNAAETVVSNIKREIEDLELKIEQGNI